MYLFSCLSYSSMKPVCLHAQDSTFDKQMFKKYLPNMKMNGRMNKLIASTSKRMTHRAFQLVIKIAFQATAPLS